MRATATTSTWPASSSCAPRCRGRRMPWTAPSRCQTVRQVVEWKRPARFDDVLEVSVRTSRLGTTSFVLQLRDPPCRARPTRWSPARRPTCTSTAKTWKKREIEPADARRSRSRRRRQDRRPRRVSALSRVSLLSSRNFAQRNIRDPGALHRSRTLGPGSPRFRAPAGMTGVLCFPQCSPASSPISASSWSAARGASRSAAATRPRASPSAPRSPATAPA